MKRFIILTTTIRMMGGAQMYAANKLRYYEQLGWKPDIYFYNEGPIRIHYLKQFSRNLLQELSNPFLSSSEKLKREIIEKVIDNSSEEDELLFECHTPQLAYWGEYLAKNVNGKNTVFLIAESFPKFTNGELNFFEFKYKRKELLNTSSKSLKLIFQRIYDIQRFPEPEIQIDAYCNNVVDYEPTILPLEVTNADYTILSIGRLDKEYIKPTLDQLLKFIRNFDNIRFNLVFIGGDIENIMNDYIRHLFNNCKNVSLHLLGYLFPIPYDWLNISDVSIASANSVLVSANEGIPTIAIDTQDLQPMGVYGYTTNNYWTREDEPQNSIYDLLIDILIEKKFSKKDVEINRLDNLDLHLKPHIDFLNTSDKKKVFFDLESLYSNKEEALRLFKRKIKKMCIKLKLLKY